MFNEKRSIMFKNYSLARGYFIQHPQKLINIEQYMMNLVNEAIISNYSEIERNYNEASYLFPFWANYQPIKRGRDPRGDQVPWIEVGEHAVGEGLKRHIAFAYAISEVGIPSGADDRFILKSNEILNITDGLTDSAFLFMDIKSVGPRDNFDHAVLSPYQVSGNGIWNSPSENLQNSIIKATGSRAIHNFYPAITPIYVLSNGTIAPTIHLFVKPVYKMLNLENNKKWGQPLDYIVNVCVPNGLLLTVSPNYLKQYPQLFYPGKDTADKNPLKIRARVSFEILREIGPWRYFSTKR